MPCTTPHCGLLLTAHLKPGIPKLAIFPTMYPSPSYPQQPEHRTLSCSATVARLERRISGGVLASRALKSFSVYSRYALPGASRPVGFFVHEAPGKGLCGTRFPDAALLVISSP